MSEIICRLYALDRTLEDTMLNLEPPSFSSIKYRKPEIYTVEEILDRVILDKSNCKHILRKQNIDGDLIDTRSQNCLCFKAHGTMCVSCGIEGIFFVKESYNKRNYHLRLYAVDSMFNQVLMTKDHIVPKSKGGKDYLGNYQTMCEPCNVEKGDKL